MNATPNDLVRALQSTVVGQQDALEGLVLGLMSDGHVLLEGPPGLAKTLACRALAAALGGTFTRIQFTPDLLPSDIVGTRIFDQRESAFDTVLGPIFGNVVLADEINRAPAKVQSALLEAMQERQVTIGPQTHPLPDPFIVMATMNPLDAEGTYALPLAQMDRFLIKIDVDYPTAEEELVILDRFAIDSVQPLRGVASLDDVHAWRALSRAVHLEPKLLRYVVDIVAATRSVPPGARAIAGLVERGASPRATLAIANMARSRAALEGRDYAIPDDVRRVAAPALRHRIAFHYRRALEGVAPDDIVSALVAAVPVP